ncbi:hypothetical protein SDC9_184905 [bioreactor metagenome]|uniref:Uncharacterized protein n=1 Tax=bioreactor metagenome TaxID=1076179 RepID=A0A645HEC6_9ZZZZ
MAQASAVGTKGAVLAVAGGKLAQRQPGVDDQQAGDAGSDQRNQPRMRRAEQPFAFEEAGDAVEHFLADQDAGDESHVGNQKERQGEAGNPLQQIEPGRPAAGGQGLALARVLQPGAGRREAVRFDRQRR